jgi:branched-chain amino acid transport system ATP-binding protein
MRASSTGPDGRPAGSGGTHRSGPLARARPRREMEPGPRLRVHHRGRRDPISLPWLARLPELPQQEGGNARARRPHRVCDTSPAMLRAGLGRTFQITSIFRELSALDNVRVAALARLRRSAVFWRPYGDDAEAREQAEAALAELGLLPVADEVAGTLSHADQKLVEVAMALAAGPAVLLLDEPTSGLAPEETERVAAVLRRLGERQRVTIILIEHDMDVVFAVAERIVVLHQGRIIAEGDPPAIRADATVREVYLGGSFAERERSPHLSG